MCIRDRVYIGANDVNYLGNIIIDSRPQCIRWVDKFNGFIPADKLKSEIAWAKANGKGYSKHLPTLSVDTFARVRGGHRCRHRVVYSKGKASKEVEEIEKQYRIQDEALQSQIYKDLDLSLIHI